METPATKSMLNVQWRAYRAAAHQGQLQHQQLQELLDLAASCNRWDRIESWILPLLKKAISDGEREGSAIACASWLLRQRRPKLAKSCLELVTWQNADAQAWHLRSCIAKSLGLHDEEQQHLIHTLVLPGGLPIATYRLGQLHRARGEFDQAASWFLASLHCNPEPFHIHNELQFTRCTPKLLPELIDFYQALCVQQPERALPQQLLAHYLLKSGKTQQSIQVSREASRLELGPRHKHLSPSHKSPKPPDFVVIGVPKGGTTSLFRWLQHIPGLWCHPRKELNFFTGNYSLGREWYCAQFPRFKPDANILRGEATPNYFSHRQTPERFAKLMPKGRAILLLRDPVERALSWIRHLQRLEGLQGTMSDWLERELDQLEDLSREQLLLHPRIGTGAVQDSCYDIHLHNWNRHIDVSSQMLIISSESLFQTPARQLGRVLRFLDQPHDPTPVMHEWKAVNVNPERKQQAPTDLMRRLRAFLDRQCLKAMTFAKPVHD